MIHIKATSTVAAAAAFLALSGMASSTLAQTSTSTAETVHCYGVNSCKGTSDCKSYNHDCKGQNECKGQGFKAESKEQCMADGGKLKQ